jgi:hypothetical protein
MSAKINKYKSEGVPVYFSTDVRQILDLCKRLYQQVPLVWHSMYVAHISSVANATSVVHAASAASATCVASGASVANTAHATSVASTTSVVGCRYTRRVTLRQPFVTTKGLVSVTNLLKNRILNHDLYGEFYQRQYGGTSFIAETA